MKKYYDKSLPEARKLIADDSLPYAVLYTVLGYPVKKIITDNKRIIIAHTASVYPTWIWAPDDVTDKELSQIYDIIIDEFTPLDNYRFNTKKRISDYLMNRIDSEMKCPMEITTNIVAYECPKAICPVQTAAGHMQKLTTADMDLAIKMIGEASVAIGDRILSHDECVEAAKVQLNEGVLYIWRDADNKAVSFCDRNADDNYVKISQCYTVPEERGKGYAAQLIYGLCEDIINSGQRPMLYADADYESSNRCYQKIGFINKGQIVTIAVKNEG